VAFAENTDDDEVCLDDLQQRLHLSVNALVMGDVTQQDLLDTTHVMWPGGVNEYYEYLECTMSARGRIWLAHLTCDLEVI